MPCQCGGKGWGAGFQGYDVVIVNGVVDGELLKLPKGGTTLA